MEEEEEEEEGENSSNQARGRGSSAPSRKIVLDLSTLNQAENCSPGEGSVDDKVFLRFRFFDFGPRSGRAICSKVAASRDASASDHSIWTGERGDGGDELDLNSVLFVEARGLLFVEFRGLFFEGRPISSELQTLAKKID